MLKTLHIIIGLAVISAFALGEDEVSEEYGVIYSSTTKNPNQYHLEPVKIPENCVNDTDIIDERQKGEENYRVSLNGIKILVASPDSALAAIMLSEMKKNKGSGMLDLTDGKEEATDDKKQKRKGNMKLLSHIIRSLKESMKKEKESNHT